MQSEWGQKRLVQPAANVTGTSGNQIGETSCTAQKVALGDDDHSDEKGGLR